MAACYGALRLFVMGMAAVCNEPCDYLRRAWRLFTMSLAAICDGHGGRLQRALWLFTMERTSSKEGEIAP